MKKKTLAWTGILAISSGLLSATLAPSIQAADKDRNAVMKYRHLFMETKGKHNQAIKLLVNSKISYRHIVTHAEALSSMADDMLMLFPANSMGGKTRALDTIWDKDGKLSADFVTQAELMKIESQKMVDIAKEGNYKAIKKQLGRLANKGCRGCHTKYRGDEKE